jgi:hypothetical protein
MGRRNLLIVPLLALVALAAVIALSGGRSALERVAMHPERYDGRQVSVAGRITDRPRRVPPHMLGTFVLTDPGGRRLLVIPKPHGVLPPASLGSRVTVRGTVVALEPSADDRGGDGPADPIAIGDVAARVGARALLEAETIRPRPS